jgi:adenylylsulfate kinase-like enzyme
MTARGFPAVLQREGHPGGRRGFTVALIGCDGAGKTTVARALERATGLPVRYL